MIARFALQTTAFAFMFIVFSIVQVLIASYGVNSSAYIVVCWLVTVMAMGMTVSMTGLKFNTVNSVCCGGTTLSGQWDVQSPSAKKFRRKQASSKTKRESDDSQNDDPEVNRKDFSISTT